MMLPFYFLELQRNFLHLSYERGALQSRILLQYIYLLVCHWPLNFCLRFFKDRASVFCAVGFTVEHLPDAPPCVISSFYWGIRGSVVVGIARLFIHKRDPLHELLP